MKYILNKVKQAGVATMALFLAAACSNVLDEQPRTFYEPGFFKTEQGVYGGLTAMYAHLRYIYGQAYYYNICQTGTDEVTYGASADNNFKDADLSGVGSLNSSSSRSDVLWGTAFSNINTASGVIENAAEVGISEALIAEARFFRAFDYFQLVQTFGGVPLDLGAGELKFNTAPTRTSVRNTVPEVYTKAIFPDLKLAVENLPEVGRVTGGATRTLARLFLAKAYLTYGWWLENPKNIPTYPACDRVDPDGKTAHDYFQMAYDVALEAIQHPGPFGLQPTFYEVNVGSNDRNNEILLYADHTQGSDQYNGAPVTGYESGSAPANFACWMTQWSYDNFANENNEKLIMRAATQSLGRPWTRMCPTINVLKETFADKENDSRYDGTFVTVYRANWPTNDNKAFDDPGLANKTMANANGIAIKPGEAVVSFVDVPGASVQYPAGDAGKNGFRAGTVAGRSDYVFELEAVTRKAYPGNWKIGVYRTDNGNGRGEYNVASTRPFNIAKFSELYLIAAEAAVKGATGTMSARDLVNVLRARAGKWSFSNAGNVEKVADYSAAMVAATPATITIDYILDERSREFYGEGYRWFDLVRTQMWKERAGTYRICEGNNVQPTTVTRTIEDYLYLRPIPQSQLDGMEMTAGEKAKYQNPGY